MTCLRKRRERERERDAGSRKRSEEIGACRNDNFAGVLYATTRDPGAQKVKD